MTDQAVWTGTFADWVKQRAAAEVPVPTHVRLTTSPGCESYRDGDRIVAGFPSNRLTPCRLVVPVEGERFRTAATTFYRTGRDMRAFLALAWPEVQEWKLPEDR